MGNKASAGGGSSKVGEKLNSSVYLLHGPDRPQVELVFIHGLQHGDFKDAFWKTWLARDGSDANCWPSTWLKQRMPRARILSLSYDSSDLKSPTTGNMDLYALGEKLLGSMVMEGIGQNAACPVVFVCHSLGGLVAKQIVVHADDGSDPRAKNLLQNTKGFFFYATPHLGSKLADLADEILTRVPLYEKGLVVDYLRVLDKNTAVLNNRFEQICREVERKIFVVGETHMTKLVRGVYKMVVPESSAKLFGQPFMPVDEDHMNVCKPKSYTDTSFKALVDFVANEVCPKEQLQLEEIVLLT